MKNYFAALFMAAISTSAQAESFRLELPVQCDMEKDCVIQNYVDHNEAEGDDAYHDFTCGTLSYDGHKGTDIRARHEGLMEKGIPVLAAADGTVLSLRDGVADKALAIKGKECGNGVLIEHGQGWKTQYCHLRKDSVAVKKGDAVKAGDTLGLMGMSGSTEFPHLHLQLTKYGAVIDPYVGITNYECDDKRASLWSAAASPKVEYVRTGILGAGFTTEEPTQEEIWAGHHRAGSIRRDAPLLIGWVELFGLRKGDVMTVELLGPDGESLAKNKELFERSKARIYSYIGKKRPDSGWPEGEYTLQFRVLREAAAGGEIRMEINESRTVNVKPPSRF